MKIGTDYNDTVGGQNYAHGRVVYKKGFYISLIQF